MKALAGAPDDSVVAGGAFTVMNQVSRSLLKIPAPAGGSRVFGFKRFAGAVWSLHHLDNEGGGVVAA